MSKDESKIVESKIWASFDDALFAFAASIEEFYWDHAGKLEDDDYQLQITLELVPREDD